MVTWTIGHEGPHALGIRISQIPRVHVTTTYLYPFQGPQSVMQDGVTGTMLRMKQVFKSIYKLIFS